MDNLEIIRTGDGSPTLFNSSLNETYHSRHGAFTESIHVFIKNGLDFFKEKSQISDFKIFEMGFGTGLNAVLAWKYSEEKKATIEYHSIEASPIDETIVSQLDYFPANSAEIRTFHAFHELPWDKKEKFSEKFTIKKITGRIELLRLEPEYYQIIFFDAFAPAKQDEVWKVEILKKIVESLVQGGVFVTYCAKGQLKRDLKMLGCEVETLPGPPGKKEMVRAVKMSTPARV